ncbi:FkbM family methyltransferase [uncultured Winogradskyella sp.]|uniref:FkbM family methyltransferase n=1 Tax=uncultured Winogradskyella sp. TaxID=395353 RepID=UPI002619594D|nr:FkbM family methyltransferase [uncultured Winogradskyella sp.]
MNFINQHLRRKKSINFYRALIKEKSLCFDIGANIGYKSSILLNLQHHVIGFEPQKNCYYSLLKIQKKHPNFKIKKIAIGAENTELDLFIGSHIEIATLSHKFKSYFTTDNIYWNQKERVKVVTLNSQIEMYGIPDFCKIDAEGYEYEILKNLSYKISIIEFEFTGGFIEETLQCISKFDDLGDYTFNYMLNEKPKLELKNWISAKEMSTEIKAMDIGNLHGNIFAKLK